MYITNSDIILRGGGKKKAMKKMILRLVLSGLVLIAILLMPVSVFAVNDSEVSNVTDETVSALSCNVYVKIDDPCCKGYCVYVDGVYQFTEGQTGTPDGYCAFHVSSGTHKFELRKGGYSTSKSWYCQCGTVYRWVSMPCGWCGPCPTSDPEPGPDPECQVYIKVEDPCCKGYSVYVDGSYILTEGASGNPDGFCAFHVSSGTHKFELRKGGHSTSKSWYCQCGTVYRWVSMPCGWCGDCQVYVQVDDNTCTGFDVYVDGAYILTEGASGNPDGECAFFVSRGTHKFELRKGGYSTSKSWYCSCDTNYRWVSMPDYWCGCQIDVQIADDTCVGYQVYVDGVYKLAEDHDGSADGCCTFQVDKGTHTIMITKNGRSESITKNFECGTTHRWDSMPEHWCGDPCEIPPSVTFDKTNYYEGDTVHATVSTSFSSVYYEIKDGSGMVRKSGSTSNGEVIYYALPAVVEKCCDWQICLYWGSGMELQGTGSECSESYDFFVCYPPEIFDDLIFLSGPVNATITDQYGRVIDDSGINQIPNTRVVTIGELKKFVIPSDLDYTVEIEAYDYGEFTYGQISPKGGDFVHTLSYLNIPVAPSSKALVVDDGNRMNMDYDGDGIYEANYSPDVNERTSSIQLHTGWNLISLPKKPEPSDVQSVMRLVEGNCNSVWSYESGTWKRYNRTGPSFLNDLSTLGPGKGYWINMKSDDRLDDLYVFGKPAGKSIPLASGWNLVGYNSLSSTALTDAMNNSVPGNWNSVWTYEEGRWKRYNLTGEVFLNDLETLVPGKGYWIDMKSDATWTLGA